MGETRRSEFERATAGSDEQSLGAELLDFLRHNKKWWLLPLLVILLLLGVLIFLSTTAVAPFVYTLF